MKHFLISAAYFFAATLAVAIVGTLVEACLGFDYVSRLLLGWFIAKAIFERNKQ